MNILFFLPKISNHGVGKALLNIANYLDKNGYSVTIATAPNQSSEIIDKFSKRIYFFFQKNGESKFSYTKRILSLNNDFYVGVQTHNAFWLAIQKYILFSRKKIISWEHSSPISSVIKERKKSWPLLLLIKFILSFKTNAYFCVSNGAKKELINSKIISSGKIFYTPNIVLIPDRTSKKQIKKTNKKLILISIGRISFEKGLEIALKALKNLKFSNWEYWIIGEGPLKNDLIYFCKNDNRLYKKVKFLGSKENPFPFLEQADLFLLPSYFEGLPTSLVEASHYGVPIIAADCQTGPNEIVKQEENGLLFEVGNIDKLTEALTIFFENPTKYHNSSEYVTNFSEENAGNIFIKNLNKILKN